MKNKFLGIAALISIQILVASLSLGQDNPSGALPGATGMENAPLPASGPQINSQMLDQAISSVSDSQERQVLQLTLAGKTSQEISQQLSMSVQDVAAILKKGIGEITKTLQNQGALPPVPAETLEELVGALLSAQNGGEVKNIVAASLNGSNDNVASSSLNGPNDNGASSDTNTFSSGSVGEIKKDTKVNKDGEVVMDVLDLKNMDILDVLKLISQKSGINLVAGQNVKGRVTVYLKDVSVEEALSIIVEANDWAYAKEGGIIKVMTEKEYEEKYGRKFGQEIATKIVQLLYVKPPDLIPILDQMKSSVGKIIADEKSNSLVLLDQESKISQMQKIIDQLDVPMKSEVFDLNYAKAEDISGKVTELLTPGLGRMKFDQRSNRLVIYDTAPKMKSIKEIINAFDKKDKQVLIEAKIIQIVLSDEFKMGIDWEGILNNYHGLDLKNNFSILNTGDKGGRLSIGTIDNDRYKVFVDALDAIGTTDILSSPRITAINNQEAKILVGSTEPYVTTTTTTPSSGPTTTAESVNFIEVGVKLFVTPTIHEDNFITMKIKPEVSSVTRTITTSTNNSIPVVETSEAETTVLAKDGVTIVIGGLIKEEGIKASSRVPFLGNIPFLGFPFRNKSNKTSKTEIVIFLTPKIISGDVREDSAAAPTPLVYQH